MRTTYEGPGDGNGKDKRPPPIFNHEDEDVDHIDERIRANTRLVLEETKREGCLPRTAALGLAKRRVHAALATRRWH